MLEGGAIGLANCPAGDTADTAAQLGAFNWSQRKSDGSHDSGSIGGGGVEV